MEPIIRLNPIDNVAVVCASAGLMAGERFTCGTDGPFTCTHDITRGQKIALASIAKGAPVLKYGHLIGIASSPIVPGDHVHTHNMGMPTPGQMREADGSDSYPTHPLPQGLPLRFEGYKRANGNAGIRNYIVVAATVNCSATVVKAVCRHFLNADFDGKQIHGVIPVSHSMGCAQAIGGLGFETLNRTLAGWIFHTNVVGAIIIGLGCEGTTAKTILCGHPDKERVKNDIPIKILGIQDLGGTAEAIKAGISAVAEIIKGLPAMSRSSLPVSCLRMALNCGGSDAFSGITANPALGVASDILVGLGGTVALAEIPECHGAEGLLMGRCVNDADRQKLRDIFDWWGDYASRHNVELNNNLSPGNISGGLTTIIEKSLGAVAKAGGSPLAQVIDYSDEITRPGFVMMNTPGLDPVSVTGLVAGGCNLVAFTTGRGSVYGCSIAPTIKIATNSEIYKRMRGDMDIDAGRALEDGDVSAVGHEIYRFAVDVASGKKTCSESLGLGWEEFAPWAIGETL